MSEPAVGEGGSIIDERFDRPLLIVSPPRSGSTLLFETMEQAPASSASATESHSAIESIPVFHPGNRRHSNRLTAAEAATPAGRAGCRWLLQRAARPRRPAAPTVRCE